MKRKRRRLLAATIGSLLGWSVAGLATAPAAFGSSEELSAHGAGEGGHDAAAAAAGLLQVPEGGAPWYPWVVAVAVGLFVAAIAYGVYGPKPGAAPEPDDGSHH